MAIYTGVGGSAKSVSKIYTGIDGVARPVYKGYVGVNGQAKQFFDGGQPLSSFAIGSSIGIGSYSYILVHKGIPGGGMYDSTANGAWLWRSDVVASTSIASGDSNYIYGYENYALDNWCKNYPANYITSSIRRLLKTVNLPYVSAGNYSSATVTYGSNGLKRNCFLLSSVEMGIYTWQGVDGLMAQEGAKLDYFDYTTSATDKRKADSVYWTRSKRTHNGNYMYTFNADGSFSSVGHFRDRSLGLRPCVVLPLNVLAWKPFSWIDYGIVIT